MVALCSIAPGPHDPCEDAGGPAAQRSRLPLGPGWWPALAGAVAAAGAQCALPAGDIRRLTVIVERGVHVAALRQALLEREQAERPGRAFFPPRILVRSAWLAEDDEDPARHQADLYEVLRASDWVRLAFGAQPQVTWALAREACALGDELTLAAAGAPGALQGRLHEAMGAHFSERCADAVDAQSRLVLSLWQAAGAQEQGAARRIAQARLRVQGADGPLIWAAPYGASGWEWAVARAWAATGHPAWVCEGEPAALGAVPAIAAAWPELVGRADDGPLAERAARLARPLPPPLQVMTVADLEQEAQAAARWVRARLAEGASSIAVVALDRSVARRTRALLEREAILVRDEAGWKLSTTSAAAALVGWIDVAMSRFAAPRLLEWMRSPFVLAGDPGAGAVRRALQRAADERGAQGGPVTALLPWLEADDGAAEQALRRLEQAASAMPATGPVALLLDRLEAALQALGMRDALGHDPVGRTVLACFDRLRAALAGCSLHLDQRELRALIADAFEQANAIDETLRSPVLMCSLAGTRLRRFDAVLLLGAVQGRLPAEGRSGALLPDAVRRGLGLPDREHDITVQMLDLAHLLASGALVTATWRQWQGGEPIALAPPLERLRLLLAATGSDPGIAPAPEPPRIELTGEPPSRPAPVAAGRLPSSLSVGMAQQLVDCPYRFFAQAVLGLRERGRPGQLQAPRAFGVLLHELLAQLQGEMDAAPGGDAGSGEHVWRDRARALVDASFAPVLPAHPQAIALRQRLQLIVPALVGWLLAQRAQGWVRGTSERGIRAALDVAGHAIELRGRIDRVEERADGTRRLLDYKSSTSSLLSRRLKAEGEEIQLAIYAALLERAGEPAPQSAHYVFVRARPALSTGREKPVQQADVPDWGLGEGAMHILERLESDLRRIDAGEGLPALGEPALCERCEMSGLCRRGAWQLARAGQDAP